MSKADAILLKHLPALKEAARPYQDEEKAYQAYYAALIAVPYSRAKRWAAFDDWQKLYKNMSKNIQALLLLQRIAERYPPELFICDDDGWANCMLCSCDRNEQHDIDCVAVLIQEFKVTDE